MIWATRVSYCLNSILTSSLVVHGHVLHQMRKQDTRQQTVLNIMFVSRVNTKQEVMWLWSMSQSAVCKWFKKEVGCKRQNCDFLHDTLANTENVAKKEVSSYKCAGCKDTWQNERCVVKHVFADKQIYLCLNCDDWITKKSEVIKSDWTLLDGQGNLRRDVWGSNDSE